MSRVPCILLVTTSTPLHPPCVAHINSGVFKPSVGFGGQVGMGGITGRFEIVKSTMDIPNHCTYTCPFDFDWNPSGSGTIHFEPNVDGYSVYTGYINTNCQGDQDWCQQWHGEGTLTLTNGTMYHGQFLRKSTDRNSPLRDGIYADDDAIFQSMLPVKYDKLRFISMFVEVHRKRLLHKLSVPFVGVCTLPSGETRVGEFRLVCPFIHEKGGLWRVRIQGKK